MVARRDRREVGAGEGLRPAGDRRDLGDDETGTRRCQGEAVIQRSRGGHDDGHRLAREDRAVEVARPPHQVDRPVGRGAVRDLRGDRELLPGGIPQPERPVRPDLDPEILRRADRRDRRGALVAEEEVRPAHDGAIGLECAGRVHPRRVRPGLAGAIEDEQAVQRAPGRGVRDAHRVLEGDSSARVPLPFGEGDIAVRLGRGEDRAAEEEPVRDEGAGSRGVPFESHVPGADREKTVDRDRARGRGHRVVHPDRGGAVGQRHECGGAAGGHLDAGGGVLGLELGALHADHARAVPDRDATAGAGDDAHAVRAERHVACRSIRPDRTLRRDQQRSCREGRAEESSAGEPRGAFVPVRHRISLDRDNAH